MGGEHTLSIYRYLNMMLSTNVTPRNLIENLPLLLIYPVASQTFITFLVAGLAFWFPWLPLLMVVKPRDVPHLPTIVSPLWTFSSIPTIILLFRSILFDGTFLLLFSLLCYISQLFLLCAVSPDWPLNHSFWCVVGRFFGKR